MRQFRIQISETTECKKRNVQAGSDYDQHKMIICVTNCTGNDPINGDYIVPFGASKNLLINPRYDWVDDNGDAISSVRCDFNDFGGVHEGISLSPNYAWVCKQGFYMGSDRRCRGK